MKLLAAIVSIGLLASATLHAAPDVPAAAAPLAAPSPAKVSFLERQRQSIARQSAARGPGASFFVSPWLPGTVGAVSAANTSVRFEDTCEALPEDRLGEIIAAAATKEDISPQLIRAVIRRESAARPCAVSDKGAQGLMQLMPATQQTLGVTDAFDPAANVNGGARYLADLLKRYKGDVRRTLAAYNAGPQRVAPDGAVTDIPETQSYVAAIMADLDAQSPAGVTPLLAPALVPPLLP